jgi:hypothetical protein
MRPDTFLASPAHAQRYRQLRRSLQREYVRRKPTRLERSALDNAALLITRLEFVMREASTTPDQMAKVSAASRRALEHLQTVAAERTPEPMTLPTFEARA